MKKRVTLLPMICSSIGKSKYIILGQLTYVNTLDLKFVNIIHMESVVYIELIKDVMAEKRLNQQQFANMIGVNQTTVSQWLLGHKKPGYDNIYAICTCFDITPNEFFGLYHL